MILNREEILNLIKEKNLITNYINLDFQLTPNGFDLTVEKIFAFKEKGALDFSNKERVLPVGKEILPKCRSCTQLRDSNTLSADGESFELAEDSEFVEPKSRTIGWWILKKGSYKVLTNEIINLPYNLVALAFSRTSLLRMGCFTQHGVWDAGFQGKSEFILVVENPYGIKIKQNARLAQLIFIKIKETKQGYQGLYQGKI